MVNYEENSEIKSNKTDDENKKFIENKETEEYDLINNTKLNDLKPQNLNEILAIKIPAKVVNIDKAIKLLGGIENIENMNSSDDDIFFKLLNIDLEKSKSFDLLLRKKRKRSKK